MKDHHAKGPEETLQDLPPVARVNLDDCQRMAAAFVQHRCNTRQAGQLYAAWREGSRVVRERILAEPELFLKTQRQPPATRPAAAGLERDLEMAVAILHRASRQLAEVLPEMDRRQQEQAQGQIENARRELDRMAARIGKQQEAKHAEPGKSCARTPRTCRKSSGRRKPNPTGNRSSSC